jgi:hypothetical protein
VDRAAEADAVNGRARFAVASPPPHATGGSAIAIIDVTGDAPGVDHALAALGAANVPEGRPVLRRVADADTAIIVRWSATHAQVMPHGGRVIVETIAATLQQAGAMQDDAGVPARDPRERFPEAADLAEACMMDTLWRSASPIAIGVLARQRDLWRAGDHAADHATAAPECDADEARALSRVITPASVVLVGPPNVGKSTLTNAMARRPVSIVADEPGTTRDHVGVMLDVGGLVVRWIDAPGLGLLPSDRAHHAIDHAAAELARRVMAAADLLLVCGDAASGYLPDDQLPAGPARRYVATRADLGLPPHPGAQSPGEPTITTAARTGMGLAALASVLREALVPRRVIEGAGRWRFHPALGDRPG